MEDLLTKSGRKRCVKMAVPNLSVLPKKSIGDRPFTSTDGAGYNAGREIAGIPQDDKEYRNESK